MTKSFTGAWVIYLLVAAMLGACGGSRDEKISGVAIPVPSAMKAASEKPAEISFLGFGAGQATYRGNMESEKLVDFYKKEMPARGWQPSMNLLSGGAMLAYGKDGKSVLIGISEQKGETVLTLTVGGAGK